MAMVRPERISPGLRGLPWVVAGLAAALAPHVRFLPAWVTLLFVAAAAWRWAADRRPWSLPPKWLRVAATLAATLAVLGTFRTLNGIEAGTAFLALMAAAKLLETRASRDLSVLVFIAYFMLYAALLRDQGLSQLPYLLAVTVFATAALMRVHGGSTGDSGREVLQRAAVLLLQALPLALLMFLLFPRLPGPFWGIAAGDSARTGLGDEMTPGDISDLSVSGDVAFRVRFFGPLPPPALRYWRGPVLHEFDGRSWRRPRAQSFPEQPVEYVGEPVDYQITLEPTDRPWITALDVPAQWPARQAYRSYDFQLVAPRRLTDVSSYRLRSYPRYVAGKALPQTLRATDTRLPAEGNPRSRELARELAVRHGGDPLAISDAMLDMFREQPFVYTLDPPKLAENAMDEFLFDTRRGFCEHYAAAFTLVMRAAGVPARVVTGYQGGEFNPIGGYLIVRQSDAHAWSEIWVEGRGWLRVDPTAAVAPERIELGLIRAVSGDEAVPGRLRDASDAWLQVELTWDTLNDFWNERVVRFTAARQVEMLEQLGFESPDWRTLGLGMAASLAAFFVSLSLYLAWRYREPARDWPARLHAEVVRRLRKRGLTPAAAEGPTAFLERAMQACPDLESDLATIRRLYVSLRYGPVPTDADLRRLKHLVNRLRP
jgi:transglutaminase-like putative cysteine protease